MLIAQITDSHIVPKGTHWSDEPAADTAGRLSRAIEFLNNMPQKPDVVLFTGDATDNGDAESYAYFRELVAPLQAPLFVIPGNHDNRDEMRKSFSDHSYIPAQSWMHYCIEEFPVRLIGMDSLVVGKPYGEICEERALWLEKTLQKFPDKPALLFMHHLAVKIGAKVFDTEYTCHTVPRFEAAIKKSSSLLGTICGHYHTLCISTLGGKNCFAAPSLVPYLYCPHPDDPHPSALELDHPAVSLHRWLGGNHFTTHIVRITENPRRIPWKDW